MYMYGVGPIFLKYNVSVAKTSLQEFSAIVVGVSYRRCNKSTFGSSSV